MPPCIIRHTQYRLCNLQAVTPHGLEQGIDGRGIHLDVIIRKEEIIIPFFQLRIHFKIPVDDFQLISFDVANILRVSTKLFHGIIVDHQVQVEIALPLQPHTVQAVSSYCGNHTIGMVHYILFLICWTVCFIISLISCCDGPPDHSNPAHTNAITMTTMVMPYRVTNGKRPPMSRSTSDNVVSAVSCHDTHLIFH